MLNSYEVRTESRVNFIGAGWYGHKKKPCPKNKKLIC